MTLEEAIAALEAEKAARIAAETSRVALTSKMDELLSETKAAKAARREADDARTAAEEAARVAAEEAAARSGDVDTLRASLESRHERTLATERARAEAAETQLSRLVVDGGTRDALVAAGVAPSLMRAASLQFRDGRKIEIKDGEAKVDGVPLSQAVTEWTASDEGSVFKAAGQATGGGAPGGGKPMGRALADMNEAERFELAKQGKLKPLLA